MTKAVIKNVDMTEELQKEAIDCATQAIQKYNVEKDIASYIKKEFDKHHNPTWHCIVGRNFGSFVTHESKVIDINSISSTFIWIRWRFSCLNRVKGNTYFVHFMKELLICLILSFQFVYSIYKTNDGHRDDVSVIKARIRSSVVSIVFAITLLTLTGYRPLIHGSELGQANVFLSMKMAATSLVLYAGPLYELVLDSFKNRSEYYNQGWITFRNVVAAPIAEEIVFRSCLIPVLADYHQRVIIAPLFFGLAHIHHYLNSTEASRLENFLFQFAYTYLFGLYASCLLVRSNSVIGPILAHSFCNFMGIPQIDDRYRGSKAIFIIGATIFVVIIINHVLADSN